MAGESIEARAKRAAELEKLGTEGALDEALELRAELVALCKTEAPGRVLAEQRALVALLVAGGDLGEAARTCEDMAARVEAARIDARPELVAAWWTLAVARQQRGETAGALDAILRLASLWRYRECTHAIETTLRGARSKELALYELLRTRVLTELAKESPPSPLEREIATRPDDVELYLVLADELIAQGDPRGELIAIHHEMRAFPKGSAALAKREYELLYHHHMRLLGPLEFGDAQWHLGFWRRVTLKQTGVDHHLVRELAVHRSALVLDTLRLEISKLATLRAVAAWLRDIPRVELPNLRPEEDAAREILPNAVF